MASYEVGHQAIEFYKLVKFGLDYFQILENVKHIYGSSQRYMYCYLFYLKPGVTKTKSTPSTNLFYLNLYFCKSQPTKLKLISSRKFK